VRHGWGHKVKNKAKDEVKEALEEAIKAEDAWKDVLEGRDTELDDYSLQLYKKHSESGKNRNR